MTPEERIERLETFLKRTTKLLEDIEKRLKEVERWIDYEQQCREDDE